MGLGPAFPLWFPSAAPAPPHQRLGVVLHFPVTAYALQVARHFVNWLLHCFHLSTCATVINFASYALTDQVVVRSRERLMFERYESEPVPVSLHQIRIYPRSLSLAGHLSQQLLRCLTQPLGKYDSE